MMLDLFCCFSVTRGLKWSMHSHETDLGWFSADLRLDCTHHPVQTSGGWPYSSDSSAADTAFVRTNDGINVIIEGERRAQFDMRTPSAKPGESCQDNDLNHFASETTMIRAGWALDFHKKKPGLAACN